MTGELFLKGRLEMSDTPLAADPAAPLWAEMPGNSIPTVLALLLFCFMLKDIFKLVPSLLFALQSSHGTASLEYNLSLSRIRNRTALLCVLPLGLIMDRFALYQPDFLMAVDSQWHSSAMIGCLAAFLLLRAFIYTFVRPPRVHSDELATLRHSPYNFFISLTCVMVLSCCILSFCEVADGVIRVVALSESALFFLRSLLRSGQILRGHCGVLATFLYLCALEIAAVAILVVSAVVF